MSESGKPSFKCGYCAIVGRPNAGKSTLLNHLCGEMVAIVTEKPQTTRDAITAIKTTAEYQMIFLDTPGLHESNKALNQKMVRAAEEAAKEADLLLFLCDATQDHPTEDLAMAQKLMENKKPLLVAINKIDVIRKEFLLPVMKMWADAGIAVIIPVSAKTGEGTAELEKEIAKNLPDGPALYPEDMITDQRERFLAAEIIRSKIMLFTHMEVPYSSMVSVEEYKERSEAMTAVKAVIYVEKESQKGIVIGAGGSMIKKIGQSARQDLEKRFGRKFFLDLEVKTRKDWTKDAKFIKRHEADYKG
jgi:GTP-binding protein Era